MAKKTPPTPAPEEAETEALRDADKIELNDPRVGFAPEE